MTDKQSIALKINDWLNDCVAESGAFFLNTVEDGRQKMAGQNRVPSVSTC